MYFGLYIFLIINFAVAAAFFSMQTVIGNVISVFLVLEGAVYFFWRRKIS
jgi:hypothetical protein